MCLSQQKYHLWDAINNNIRYRHYIEASYWILSACIAAQSHCGQTLLGGMTNTPTKRARVTPTPTTKIFFVFYTYIHLTLVFLFYTLDTTVQHSMVYKYVCMYHWWIWRGPWLCPSVSPSVHQSTPCSLISTGHQHTWLQREIHTPFSWAVK